VVAPAVHEEDAEGRGADLAGVDGVLHAPHRLVEAALADHAQAHARGVRRRDHRIAIRKRGCQRLSTSTCTPAWAA